MPTIAGKFEPAGHCLVCHQGLVRDLYDGTLLDDAWDEAVCYPHEDMGKIHVTKLQITDWAEQRYAPRPGGVATAMVLILNYWHFAPDDKPERSVIDAAMKALARNRSIMPDPEYDFAEESF